MDQILHESNINSKNYLNLLIKKNLKYLSFKNHKFLCKLMISATKAAWFGILWWLIISFNFCSNSLCLASKLCSCSSSLRSKLDNVFSTWLNKYFTFLITDEYFFCRLLSVFKLVLWECHFWNWACERFQKRGLEKSFSDHLVC